VRPRYREDGYGLGRWVSRQRINKIDGTLDPECRARLEALPGWTWDPYAEDWEQGFVHLQHFVKREGHARVPAGYREDGFRLGQWVGVQRSAFRNERLDAARRRRLDGLPDGFGTRGRRGVVASHSVGLPCPQAPGWTVARVWERASPDDAADRIEVALNAGRVDPASGETCGCGGKHKRRLVPRTARRRRLSCCPAGRPSLHSPIRFHGASDRRRCCGASGMQASGCRRPVMR
jgi:hypothetical protein